MNNEGWTNEPTDARFRRRDFLESCDQRKHKSWKYCQKQCFLYLELFFGNQHKWNNHNGHSIFRNNHLQSSSLFRCNDRAFLRWETASHSVNLSSPEFLVPPIAAKPNYELEKKTVPCPALCFRKICASD